MKINELIDSFDIYMTNEEKRIYESLNERTPLAVFNEREQFIIKNMVRKSLVSKIVNNNQVLVIKNV
jgi:hypothetical protein